MTKSETESLFNPEEFMSRKDFYRYSSLAMGTIFEIFICHEESDYASQAAQAAFDELDRLESDLSRFIESSDISQINDSAVNVPLAVGLETFECLEISKQMYEQTGGAFDVTVGSLYRCWLNDDKTLRSPTPEELEMARANTGCEHIILDDEDCTVTLTKPVKVDLGGIGKGYAVDKMAELLGEWSIDKALLSGGGSSILALDSPLGTKGWPVTVSDPRDRRQLLAGVDLRNMALSGSGLEKGSHIIDPRSGEPVSAKTASWVYSSKGAAGDALSTAFMIMSSEQIASYCADHVDTGAMTLTEHDGKGSIERFGIWKKAIG